MLNKTNANALAGAGSLGNVTNTGSLTINNSAIVRLSGTGDDQIADTAGPVFAKGGTFDLNSHNETISGLQLGDGTGTPSITATTGVLTSLSTIAAQSGSSAAVLNGTTGLTKTTAGTVILSAPNSYSGNTAVSAGVLTVTGSINNSTNISTDPAAVLNASGATNGGLPPPPC